MATNMHNESQAQSRELDRFLRLLRDALLTTPDAEQALAAVGDDERIAPSLARKALSSLLAELLKDAISQVPALSGTPGQVNNSLPQAEHEVERLETLTKELQEECDKLRQSLAEVKAERDLYRKAVYENARAGLHFEDVTIPELQAATGGPVQLLD